jgi:hypothetical protein
MPAAAADTLVSDGSLTPRPTAGALSKPPPYEKKHA